MNAKRSDKDRVIAIFTIIQEMKLRLRALNYSRAEFSTAVDPITRNHVDGIEVCIFRITEDIINLSEEFKDTYPVIEWHKIRGLRNVLAHDYGSVDPEIVWDTAHANIPLIEEVCKQYARDNGFELKRQEQH